MNISEFARFWFWTVCLTQCLTVDLLAFQPSWLPEQLTRPGAFKALAFAFLMTMVVGLLIVEPSLYLSRRRLRSPK